MKNISLFSISILYFTLQGSVTAQTSSLVYIGSGGKLEYRTYENTGQANKVNTIPDFSFAGYKGGGVALPVVPVVETISPIAGDARLYLQEAIDRVSALPLNSNGFRGTLLLKSGKYEVNGSLFIKSSGIVLRGERQNSYDNNGTELVAKSKTQHDFIQLKGNESSVSITGIRRITSVFVPTGVASFEITDTEGLSVGDTIKVTRTPNDNWIKILDMAQYGWTAADYKISYERIITGINGKIITVNIPLVQSIETNFGGGEISKVSVKGRLKNCGIEKMMITSSYLSDTDEEHGWSAITLSQTTDCWVSKVTARYFGYSCVGLYGAYNTTVEECAMLDPKSITTGSRKYSFYIDKGSFNLFQRCFTRGGRHDFTTGSRVAGPNVFVDCFSTQTFSDIGPHHRYATGILFDNISGGETRVQNRKDMGTGHGWAGAQTMFWNCQSDAGEFKVESPAGAMNWGIGCKGLIKSGAGFWESWGIPVMPRSFYFQQLQDRLGIDAVENVTTAEQRKGNIWVSLMKWGGVGDYSLITGIETEPKALSAGMSLEQNYPNPFNPETNINYHLPAFGHVSLDIFDSLGRKIETLVDEFKPAGSYNYQFSAQNIKSNNHTLKLSSGVYFYRLAVNEFISVKKMVLLK